MSKNNKGNGKYNKRKQSYKRNPKDVAERNGKAGLDRDSRELSTDKYINDFTWMSMGDPIDTDVYDYSVNGFAGAPINLHGGSSEAPHGFTSPNTHLATIMRVCLCPSPGFIDNNRPADAPINRNGYNLFTQLSSVNAKTTNYAPQDITMAILAVGELISMHSYITRSLALPYVYNFRNRSYPIMATEASGLDYDDLKQNLANYRTRFNLLCALADSIYFPSQFDYFKKCELIYSHITMDGDTATAQTYITVPHHTWILDEQAEETGTTLQPRDVVKLGQLRKMSDILDLFESQILALLNSSTLNYVYSDINNYAMKYGMELFKLNPLAESYNIPIYSMEQGKIFLNQVMNATIMGNPLEGSNVVHSDPNNNSILFSPAFRSESPSWGLDKVLNFYEYPDFKAKADYAAYAAMGEGDGEEGYLQTKRAILPDHYISQIHIFRSNDRNQALVIDSSVVNMSGGDQTEYLAYMTNFDYAPILVTTAYDSEAATYDVTGILGDVGYFTTLNWQQLSLINYTAMTSLFKWKK